MSTPTPTDGAPQMREIQRLLGHYGESHQHPTNEKIHFVCVPVIVWTVLGLVWSIHPWAAYAGAALALLYYVSLSIPFAIGMAIMAGIMLLILQSIPSAYVLPTAGAVFVIAWIGQFIGHKIEGKKPSFFEDIRYLLIGPLFAVSYTHLTLPTICSV